MNNASAAFHNFYPTLVGGGIVVMRYDHRLPGDEQFKFEAFHLGRRLPHRKGWGATEDEALTDLRRLDREHYEWEHALSATMENDNDTVPYRGSKGPDTSTGGGSSSGN